jgi:hypothetical protein
MHGTCTDRQASDRLSVETNDKGRFAHRSLDTYRAQLAHHYPDRHVNHLPYHYVNQIITHGKDEVGNAPLLVDLKDQDQLHERECGRCHDCHHEKRSPRLFVERGRFDSDVSINAPQHHTIIRRT